MLNSEKKYPIPDWVFATLHNRETIVFEYMKDNTIGAELGVFRGVFSEFILKKTKIKKLYMVDGWDIFGKTFGWGDDYTCNDTLPTAVARKEAEERTEHFKDRREVITSLSQDFLKDTKIKFDWLYVDATHDFENVYNELKIINDRNLLYDDGFIIFDDFKIDADNPHYGVFQAIREFCKNFPFEIIYAMPLGSHQCVIRKTKF